MQTSCVYSETRGGRDSTATSGSLRRDSRRAARLPVAAANSALSSAVSRPPSLVLCVSGVEHVHEMVQQAAPAVVVAHRLLLRAQLFTIIYLCGLFASAEKRACYIVWSYRMWSSYVSVVPHICAWEQQALTLMKKQVERLV